MSVLISLALTAHAQSCGDTLTANTTLTADVVCGVGHTGHAFTIATDGLSFNGNGFSIIGAAGTTNGIRVTNADNVTVQNVTISGVSTAGILLNNTHAASVASVTASGLPYGVNSSGTNTALTLINNNVSNSTLWGMRLLGTGPLLDMASNNFTGSDQGLQLASTVGGTVSGSSSNVFTNVANSSSSKSVIYLNSANGVTVNGLSLPGTNGRGIYVSSGTDITLSNNTITGRFRGIMVNGTNNTDLDISDNNLSNSTNFALHMTSLQLPLVFEGNTFDGSLNGVYLNSITGPWNFPTTNTFDNVPSSGTTGTYALDLVLATDITVADLDLSANVSGRGRAIRLNDSDGVTIDNVIATAHNTGLFASTETTDLTVLDSDFSLSTSRGMQLANLLGTIAINDVLLDDSANGILIQNTYGPIDIDLGDVSFVGVVSSSAQYVVRAEDSADITVKNVFADQLTTGRAIQAVRVDDSTIQGFTVCGALRAIDLQDTYNIGLVGNGIGSSTTALLIDSVSDLTTGSLQVLNNTNNLTDNGTNTSVVFTALPDADMNGIPDICDTCPFDPYNDLDNDGLCGDVDDDDDGDGVLDVDDLDPNNNEICGDSDDDDCDDCNVANMFAPGNDGLDTDADGLCNLGDPDDDNDGIDDGADTAPLDNTVCRDDDLDGCDDCTNMTYDPGNDGDDDDTDGVCNPKDLSVQDDNVFNTTDVSWSTGGVGSPSVVYDPASSLFVMVFETQIGTHSDCPVGVWAIGLATSPDGLVWTDSGGPLVQPVPQSNTYYECVVAHPDIVDRFTGALRVFYKTEQGKTPNASSISKWGSGQYTGIGRLSLSWNSVSMSYGATTPDTLPILAIGTNFGYPRAVFSGGEYKMALTQKPNMMIATGPATGLTLGGTVWTPGDAPWAPDEVYNPAAVCESDGTFAAFLGGRELGTNEAVLTGTVGRIASTNFTSWNLGPGPIFNTSSSDVEMRHWDVLRLGTSNYALFFDAQSAGVNQIGLAQTNAGAALSSVQSKVCP